MAGRKSDFTLTKLDDLFTTQAQRDEEQLSKIRDIPLELIDDFPDHPFKVRDDEDMMQLVESVKERGVITPATVRQKEDGRYELVSGHRRKRACELAGFETLRSEIVDLNRDEATILMVESNFQRSEILPSEKAFAYKMRLEAMKRQAGRPAKNNSPVGNNLEFAKSSDELADKTGESKNQMQMKLMLACAFSYDAKLLILDEPTSGLDPVSRDELLKILSEYIEDGEHSVLFSTHITGDLERAADYITYISYGELFYTGSKDDFVDMFRIVKGGIEELSDDLKNKAAGIRTFPTGFEALMKTEDINGFSNLTIEPATIDEIVVFTSKKGDDYE